ncbi:MAG: hypothetical protein ABIP48_21260 [Planctomycetota bacterium]
MRKTLLSALAVGILLGASNICPAKAQESASSGVQTVLTVSLSGFDALKNDLKSISPAANAPQLMLPLMMLGPQGPAGLDTTKPAGAVVQTDGQDFVIFAFLPVTDLTQALGLLNPMNPEAEPPKPDADGVYEIETMGQQLVIVQKGGWAFLANSREALASVPEDPVPLLGGLNESYAVAVRATVKNVPEGMRQSVLVPLQLGLAMGQQQQPDEAPEQYALRQKMVARSMGEFTKLLNETDSLMIGLAVDSESKALRLDVEITAVEGTASAEEFALAADAKSDVAGFFLPEAAATVLVASTIPDSDAAQLEDMIDTYGSRALDDLDEQDLSDSDRQMAKQVLGDLIDVIRKTVEARRIDAGFALLASEDSLNLVGGGFVADTAKLETLFKQMVNLAIQEDPGVAGAITLDAGEHEGVRLHVLSVPAEALPGDDVPAMLVGEALTGAVGFGAQNAYFALGPQSIEKLKLAIDQSKAAAGQPVPPLRLSISATGIGRLLAGLDAAEESDLPPEVIDSLTQAGQNDHVSIGYEVIPNGIRGRFEIEEGVLKVIGAAAGAAIEQMGAGGGGFPGPLGGAPGQP